MIPGVDIRIEGYAGRITLTRPEALNAMTYEMCMGIDAALRQWRVDPAVKVVLIDALGDKAFCAGGDIAELYATGQAGDYAYGRKFWRDEYRMNAMIALYPKPVMSFMQGYTMGGGVGLGCHCEWSIVGRSSRIAMPECGIGLVPDVGGSHILTRLNAIRPGFGAWVGTTGMRFEAGDATFGFAKHFQSDELWDEQKDRAIQTGEANLRTEIGPKGAVASSFWAMSDHFDQKHPADVLESLESDKCEAAQTAHKALIRACPLAVACHMEVLRRLTPDDTIEQALTLEYRFAWRAMQRGDFLEGIRAQIIDKDRQPNWSHAHLGDVTQAEIDAMLAPLGDDELTFDV